MVVADPVVMPFALLGGWLMGLILDRRGEGGGRVHIAAFFLLPFAVGPIEGNGRLRTRPGGWSIRSKSRRLRRRSGGRPHLYPRPPGGAGAERLKKGSPFNCFPSMISRSSLTTDREILPQAIFPARLRNDNGAGFPRLAKTFRIFKNSFPN